MSKIIYAPKSWNPISGCSPVSEGCANCWAKVMARRQRQEWGTVYFHLDRLEQPLHWRKPQTVAVAFMGDLFHGKVPDEFIDKVFAVMALTPQHTYLLLTKRPERMRAYLNRNAPWLLWAAAAQVLTGHSLDHVLPWPLPNVWLGVSCENQARADERIPLLQRTSAAHIWASLEPLLEPIDLRLRLRERRVTLPGAGTWVSRPLDWIVVGGESGPHARPCDLGWIRDVVEQCRAATVPCFVKQASGLRPGTQGGIPDELWQVKQLPEGWL